MEKDEIAFDENGNDYDKFGVKKYNDKELKESLIEDFVFNEKSARGFVRCAYYLSGEFALTQKGWASAYSFRSAVVALKFCKAVEFLTGASFEIAFMTPSDKRKSRRFVVEIPEKYSLPLLSDLKVIERNENGISILENSFPEAFDDEFAEGFFTLLYLEAGKLTLYDDYKLEIQLNDEEQTTNVFAFFENRKISAGMLSESNKVIFRTDSIGSYFVLAGADKVAIDLSLYYTNKSINKDITRIENFKLANLDKTLTASASQTLAIMSIRNSDKFGLLPKDLRELAEAREKNPDSSIQRIAESLGISKSTAYHRMERIIEFAKDIDKK